MASLDWIKRTVGTAGRPCPLRLAERCPGERSGCAFWVDEMVVNAAHEHEAISGCLFAWQYSISHEVTDECKRTQVAVAQAANAVHESVKGLATAAAFVRMGGARVVPSLG